MSSRSVSSLAASTCLLVATLCAPGVHAEDLADRISSEVNRVFNERRDAVVRIEAIDKRGTLSGTGFFADATGTIYTLAYTVANADEILVVTGDRKIPARLLFADPRSGIALIKTDIASTFIPTGSSRELGLATPVMAIGYPVDHPASPSFGIIGGFDRKYLGRYFITTHIRANVPVQPGFGGAPLLNMKGEVAGIVFSGISGDGSCYALPIEAAEKIRMDYARYGEPRHGWVGVQVEEQGNETTGHSVRIVELGAETPASRAGLRDGDALLAIGNVTIHDAEDVIDAAYFLTAGDKVTISVLRDGTKVDVEIRSTKHPATETRPIQLISPEIGRQEWRLE